MIGDLPLSNSHNPRLKELWASGDYIGALNAAGPDRGTRLLLELVLLGRLSNRVLGSILGQAWALGVFPEAELQTETWVRLFRQAGFVSDGPLQPTEPLTIFRGASSDFSRGMAWTTSKAIASWFAVTSRPDRGQLYTATIKPEYVLAVMKLVIPDQVELVIDPVGLPELEILPVDRRDADTVNAEFRERFSALLPGAQGT